MRSVLVAGGTGYLGGFVIREFKNRGFQVRSLARTPEKLAPLSDSVDEIVEGEVTRPESLENICAGMDVVFSCVGITRQKDGLTFRDVDYQGNLNLLEEAKRASVSKFIYVSVFNGPHLRHLDIVAAHEEFVDELKRSSLDYTVLRPTGYFSDLGEFLAMAQRGRIYLIGSGTHRVNPIHGADLAVRCVDAAGDGQREVDLGGPEIMTWNQVAALAFRVVDRPARITHVPEWVMGSVVRVVRALHRHQGELMAFFTTMATTDVVAPSTGTHLLEAHFRNLAADV